MSKSPSHKQKKRKDQLVFKLTQHTWDEQLMISLELLVYGNVYLEKETIDLKNTKYLDINSKILPSAALHFLNIPFGEKRLRIS